MQPKMAQTRIASQSKIHLMSTHRGRRRAFGLRFLNSVHRWRKTKENSLLGFWSGTISMSNGLMTKVPNIELTPPHATRLLRCFVPDVNNVVSINVQKAGGRPLSLSAITATTNNCAALSIRCTQRMRRRGAATHLPCRYSPAHHGASRDAAWHSRE